MGGPDISQLSSNWKKLKDTLNKTDKKPAVADSNDLKRKRLPEKKSSKASSNPFKKTKPSPLVEKRTMGGYLSTATAVVSPTASDKNSRLVTDHDIDPADITAAYGAPPEQTRSHNDDINGGLHPTHKIGKYISLDCEMVGTGPPPHTDNILARASLTNFHGEQIYDSYVQPPPQTKIHDYRTFVSGIKFSHMLPTYARPFAEVQKSVAELLQGRILVGHALRNDLNALMLGHPKRDMRDTSRYAKFRVESKGRPPALRKLAKAELGLDIQSGEHSSVEDARVAMLLFRKEKVGFEEENRQRFGVRMVGKGLGKGREVTPSVEGESEGDEDEEEDDKIDLLNDEGVEEEVVSSKIGQPKTKKSKKKKKRTKRK